MLFFPPKTFSPSNRLGLRRCVAQFFCVNPALCYGVLAQPRVDNSSSGPNWSSWHKADPAIDLFIPLPTIFNCQVFFKYLSDWSPVVVFNLYLYLRNVMSGIMMTVFVTLLHPYFVFLLKSGKLNYVYQLTSKRQKCPDVQ